VAGYAPEGLVSDFALTPDAQHIFQGMRLTFVQTDLGTAGKLLSTPIKLPQGPSCLQIVVTPT